MHCRRLSQTAGGGGPSGYRPSSRQAPTAVQGLVGQQVSHSLNSRQVGKQVVGPGAGSSNEGRSNVSGGKMRITAAVNRTLLMELMREDDVSVGSHSALSLYIKFQYGVHQVDIQEIAPGNPDMHKTQITPITAQYNTLVTSVEVGAVGLVQVYRMGLLMRKLDAMRLQPPPDGVVSNSQPLSEEQVATAVNATLFKGCQSDRKGR